ncbi:MAG TPA: hypothetical protein VFB71_12280 [Ramlibacter sp.]|nr:hypothetical protein [Ramlibacter sp.]
MNAPAYGLVLNAKGKRLLVALCRYVQLHGNVTKAADGAARLLRAACDDHARPESLEVNGTYRGSTFDGKLTVQQDLDDALDALTEYGP